MTRMLLSVLLITIPEHVVFHKIEELQALVGLAGNPPIESPGVVPGGSLFLVL